MFTDIYLNAILMVVNSTDISKRSLRLPTRPFVGTVIFATGLGLGQYDNITLPDDLAVRRS
jgi:hypothetical protein